MKAIMISVIAIVVPSFVVFYGWNSKSGGSSSHYQSGTAAKVKFGLMNEAKLEDADMKDARQMLMARTQGYIRENKFPADASAEHIINDPAVVREAVNIAILKEFGRKNGVVVSDDEVEQVLRDMIPPGQGAAVAQQLASRGKTIDSYAEELQFQMLFNKIREVLAAQSRVSYYEAWLKYLGQNEKLKADFVRFNGSAYESKVKVDDAALKAYFEQNRAKFRIPDQVEYSFIAVTKDDLRTSVTTTQDDITSYYEAHKSEYKLPDSAHVRQIFLAKPMPGAESTSSPAEITSATQVVAAQAVDLFQRAAKGEDFAALADRYSQPTVTPKRDLDTETTATDTGTTAGGDLGFVSETSVRGLYPDEWASAVYHMTPGAIHPPIEDTRGFYIVKLEALRQGTTQPLEKVADTVKDQVIDEKVGPLFDQAGEALRNNSQKYTSIDKLAEATSNTVKTTGKLNKGVNYIAGIGRLGEFEEAIRDLQKGGRSDVLSDQFKHVVIEIKEEFPEQDPAFETIKAKVEQAYRAGKAIELARADAEALKAKATDLAAMKTAAQDLGATVTESRPFTRAEVATVLGPIQGFDELASELKQGQIQMSDLGMKEEPQGFVVYYVAEKIEPARADFQKALPKLLPEIAQKKADILLNEYLRDQWRQLGDKIQIESGFKEM